MSSGYHDFASIHFLLTSDLLLFLLFSMYADLTPPVNHS